MRRDHRLSHGSVATAVLLLLPFFVVGCGGDGGGETSEASNRSESAAAGKEDSPGTQLRTPSPDELPASFRSEVLRSSGPVLVYFHAPWHGDSQELLPVVEEIEDSTPDLETVTLNVDEHQPVVKAYMVPGVPFVAIFRNGEVVGAFSSQTMTAEDLRSFVARNL